MPLIGQTKTATHWCSGGTAYGVLPSPVKGYVWTPLDETDEQRLARWEASGYGTSGGAASDKLWALRDKVHAARAPFASTPTSASGDARSAPEQEEGTR